jgi:hypothetical protein
MNNDDRIEIIDSVGMDDAPALGFWLNDKKEPKDNTEQEKDLQVHRKIIALLTLATENYILMSKQMEFNKISSFLSRFAKSIEARTSSTDTEKKREKIELDGRRLGYMRRCIIGYRAMEIAHSNLYMSELGSFEESVKEAILGSIPVGINAENAIDDFAETQLKNVFDQLKDFFLEDKDLIKVNLNYELMVSPDPIRKAEILINEDIGKIAKNSAWTRIMEETSIDISILCMLALNIESVNRGTIPPNILDQMTTKIDNKTIKIKKPILMGESIKYYDRVTDLITQGANKIEQIIICNEVNKGIKNSKNEMFFTDDDFKVIVDSCNKSLEKIRKICRYKGSLEA